MPDLALWQAETSKSGGADWFDELQKDMKANKAVEYESPYPRQLRRLVEVVRGEAEPECTAEDGIRALQLVEAMFESMEKKAPTDVTLKPL